MRRTKPARRPAAASGPAAPKVEPPPRTWTNAFSGGMLCRDPLILVGIARMDLPMGGLELMGPWLDGVPLTWLVRPTWTLEAGDGADRLARAWRAHAAAYPAHRLVALSSTAAEVELCRQRGVPAELFNGQTFIEERFFEIDPAAVPIHDAVLNAAPLAWKRHALARDVPRLALIADNWPGASAEVLAYWTGVREAMPGATFCNGMFGADYRRLDRAEVAAVINQARVGLALSAVEGANRAVVEYMLCGRPVVSTPSIGGRDHYADPAWWTEVEPDPRAVADAVAAWVRRAPDPAGIRAGVVARMRAERERFIDFLQDIVDRAGVQRSIRAAWPSIFVNELTDCRDAESLMRRVLGTG